MGQYYLVVNIDKGEYLHPHRAGDGLKLMEFACSSQSTMMLLALLLAKGNGRGGGDIDSRDRMIGHWAGDRIVITGDYADKLEHVSEAHLFAWRDKMAREEPEDAEEYKTKEPNLYRVAQDLFEDITAKVLVAAADDRWVRDELAGRAKDFLFSKTLAESPALREKLGVQIEHRDT